MKRRANKESLSEERLESSPEVDRALYKHTIIINNNNNVNELENHNSHKINFWGMFIHNQHVFHYSKYTWDVS